MLWRCSRHLSAALAVLLLPAGAAKAQPIADRLPSDNTRPNILWVYIEDTNAWMSCYGDDVIATPNIDALAKRGARFNRAYMPAGVCSPTRSAVITSMYQTTIGAHEHDSSFEVWRGIRMTDAERETPERGAEPSRLRAGHLRGVLF